MANHKIEAADGVVAVDPASSPPQKIIIDTDPGIGTRFYSLFLKK